VLLQQSYQHLDAEGVFYETPENPGSITSLPGAKSVALPDLSVQNYNNSYDHDDFENTALTVTGRIGDLNLVYTGAYLTRDVAQVQDYTAYSRGAYADYYQCVPANPKTGTKAQCYSPATTWHDKEHDTHLSQEFRVSTPDDWRLRAIAGAYWEDFKVEENTDWEYATEPGYTPIAPAPGSTVTNPNVRNANDGFFNDITRGYTQAAGFASVDYDILPKDSPWGQLTATAGTRFYRFDNTEQGSEVSGYGCTVLSGYTGPTPCLNGAKNLDAENLKSEYNGFVSRGNLTWHITPDIMTYYTWSQGFRPGGFNRGTHTVEADDYTTPLEFAPDTLTNNEIGYKTTWLAHHLELDGAIYHEHWSNVQDRLFDPGFLGNTAFTVNAPNYRVYGTEAQVTYRVTQDLSLNAGGAWNYSSQLTSPTLSSNGLLPAAVNNPFGVLGSTLGQSPKVQGNVRARYEFEMGDYLPFVQMGVSYMGARHSAVGAFDNYGEDPYTSVDMSAGVSKDQWNVQAYVENLTNNRGDEFTSDAQFVKSIVVTRPLTAGVKISYTFD